MNPIADPEASTDKKNGSCMLGKASIGLDVSFCLRGLNASSQDFDH